jgi:hypothetical protein
MTRINKPKTHITRIVFVFLLICAVGCSQKVIRFKPPPADNPGLRLPVKVEVRLKNRGNSSWGSPQRSSESIIVGYLEAWKNGMLIVSNDRLMKIPADRVEAIDVVYTWGNYLGLGFLAGGGSAALVLVLLIFL